jgi:hypothetical protein
MACVDGTDKEAYADRAPCFRLDGDFEVGPSLTRRGSTIELGDTLGDAT